MAEIIGPLLLALSTWSAPQPAHGEGLLVTYGHQPLIEANAAFRGYDLGLVPGRCGLSAISPAHLGQLAWVRVQGRYWQGPCLVVDAVGRADAYDSIYTRREVAEVSRDTAAALGFTHGAWGYAFFGACPPPPGLHPQPYAPPLAWTTNPAHESFYPYPPQMAVTECGERQEWQ